MKCVRCVNEAVEGLKQCLKCKETDRLYHLQNKEKRIEYAKNYRKNNPDKCKEYGLKKDKTKKKEYNKMYREKNIEKLKEQEKIRKSIFYANNKEKINLRNNQWSKNNKLKQSERVCRYKTRKGNAFVETVDRLKIFERDNWICMLCGEPVDDTVKHTDSKYPSIDHIVPLTKGGTHEPLNVQCAHRGCNSSKRDNPLGGKLMQLLINTKETNPNE